MATVTYTLEDLPGSSEQRAVTVGKFDGVHRGHQEVVRSLRQLGEGAEVTVVTFDRHPRALLNPQSVPEALLSVNQKVEALVAAGAERVAVIPFTEEFAALSHQDFSRTVLAEGLGASIVLVGGDFQYGHMGAGNVDSLTAEGDHWGFHTYTVNDVVHDGGERISSTRVRALLAEGEVGQASELLGRLHAVRSRVVHGHQRGRLLGYPTANLDNPVEGFVPRDGVYATWLEVQGIRYPAATSIGVNPTFGDISTRIVEAHAFDFEGDLYDQVVTVHFVDYIRPMNQFPSAEALAHQMGVDAEKILDILG